MNKLIFLSLIPVLMAAIPNVYASDINCDREPNDELCTGKKGWQGMNYCPEGIRGDCFTCEFGDVGYCAPGSCYARGVEDGKNNDFGDYFKIDPSGDCGFGEFLPRYTAGFIDGCISEDNTRETCERFTDA